MGKVCCLWELMIWAAPGELHRGQGLLNVRGMQSSNICSERGGRTMKWPHCARTAQLTKVKNDILHFSKAAMFPFLVVQATAIFNQVWQIHHDFLFTVLSFVLFTRGCHGLIRLSCFISLSALSTYRWNLCVRHIPCVYLDKQIWLSDSRWPRLVAGIGRAVTVRRAQPGCSGRSKKHEEF